MGDMPPFEPFCQLLWRFILY